MTCLFYGFNLVAQGLTRSVIKQEDYDNVTGTANKMEKGCKISDLHCLRLSSLFQTCQFRLKVYLKRWSRWLI